MNSDTLLAFDVTLGFFLVACGCCKVSWLQDAAIVVDLLVPPTVM